MEGLKQPLSRAFSLGLMMAMVFLGMLAITQTVHADSNWSVDIGGERFVIGDTVKASIVPGDGGEMPASVQWTWQELRPGPRPGMKDVFTDIEGATDSEYTLDHENRYLCIATDPTTNKQAAAFFTAHYWIIADQQQYYFLGDDGKVTLKATILGSPAAGNSLSYQWRKEGVDEHGWQTWDPIEGANGTTYVAEATGHYEIWVTESNTGDHDQSYFYVQDSPEIVFDKYDKRLLSSGPRDYRLSFVVPDDSFEPAIAIGLKDGDEFEAFGEDVYSYNPSRGVLTLDGDAIKQKLEEKGAIDEDGKAQIYYDYSVVKKGQQGSYANANGYFQYEDIPNILLVNDEKCWNTDLRANFTISYVKEITNAHPYGETYFIKDVQSDSDILSITGPTEDRWTCTSVKQGATRLTVTYQKDDGSEETILFPVYVRTHVGLWEDPMDSPLYSVGDRRYSVGVSCPEGYELQLAIRHYFAQPWENTDSYVEYSKTKDDETLILHGDAIWRKLGKKPDTARIEMSIVKKDDPSSVLDGEVFAVDVCEPYFTLNGDRIWILPVGRTQQDISLKYYDNEDPKGGSYPIDELKEVKGDPEEGIGTLESSEDEDTLEITKTVEGDQTKWSCKAKKQGSARLKVKFTRKSNSPGSDDESLIRYFDVKVMNIEAGCNRLGKRYVYPGQTIQYQAYARDVSNHYEDAEDVDYRWTVVKGDEYVKNIAADENDPSKATLTIKDNKHIDGLGPDFSKDIEVMVDVLPGDPQLKDPEPLAREKAQATLIDESAEFFGIMPEDDDVDPATLAVGESFTVSPHKFSFDPASGETVDEPAALPDGYRMACVLNDEDDDDGNEGEHEPAVSIEANANGGYTITRTGNAEARVTTTLFKEDPQDPDRQEEIDRCEYRFAPAMLEKYWIDLEGYDFGDDPGQHVAFAEKDESLGKTHLEITPKVRWADCELPSDKYTLKVLKENEDRTGYTEDVTADVLSKGFPIGDYRIAATSTMSGEEETIDEYLTVYDRHSLEPFGPEITFASEGGQMQWVEGPRHMRGYYRVLLTEKDGQPLLDPDPWGPCVSIDGTILEEGVDYDAVYVKDNDGIGPEDEEAAFDEALAAGKTSLAAEPGYQVCLIKGKEGSNYSGMNGTVCFLVLNQNEMDLAAAADAVTAKINNIYNPEATGTFEERVIAAREAYDSLDPDALKYLPADKYTQLLIAEFHAKADALDLKNPDEEAIAAARAAYSRIPEYARSWMETLVAYNTLLDAEKALSDYEAAAQVADLISHLDPANPDANAVAAARAAYNRLSDDQKTWIPAATLDKLTAAEKKVADDKADAEKAEKDRQGIYDPSIPKMKVKKPTAKKARVTVKWTKLNKKQLKKSKATKYEIWICPNKGFAKGETIEKTVGKSKASIKVSLKKNTKYYVKVRAIKYVNGEKYVGKWAQKTVKTRKK